MSFEFNPQAPAFIPSGSGLGNYATRTEVKPVQMKSWYNCGVEEQKALKHAVFPALDRCKAPEGVKTPPFGLNGTLIQDEAEEETLKCSVPWRPGNSTNVPTQPPQQKLVHATAQASQHLSLWQSLNLDRVSQDPFFASLVEPWLEEYPTLRDITLTLPNSRNPNITFFPSLFRLPISLLQSETKISQKTDPRQKRAPGVIDAHYAHPLILWYREIWNQHCAARNWNLWSSGYRTDWNWASGYFPRSDETMLKAHYQGSSLVEDLGESVAVRVGLLLKGFYKMPRAVGRRYDYWGPIEKPVPLLGRNGKVLPGCQAHYY